MYYPVPSIGIYFLLAMAFRPYANKLTQVFSFWLVLVHNPIIHESERRDEELSVWLIAKLYQKKNWQ